MNFLKRVHSLRFSSNTKADDESITINGYKNKGGDISIPEPSKINDEVDNSADFKVKLSLLRKVNSEKIQICLTDLFETYTSLTQVYQRLNDDNKTFNSDNKFSILNNASTTHLNKGKYEYAFNLNWEHESAFSGKNDDGL